MNNQKFYFFAGALLAISIGFWIYMFQTPDSSAAQLSGQQDAEISLTMYSSEGCMCCVKWAEYLEDNGVTVKINKVADLQSIKEEHNVPNRLSSCHTGIVDGYVVEGHVPVEDIRSLLAEQPDVIGVSVPGMPPNSPGMDQPVDREYQSVLFDGETVTVFNTHN